MPSVFKDTDRQRKRRTLEKISLSANLLLINLVENSHFSLNRLFPPTQKRTKTTMETLSVDGDKAKTHLQLVSTLLQRRKKKASPKSIASIVEKKAIMPIYVLKKGNKSQKTSDGLGNLHTNDYK